MDDKEWKKVLTKAAKIGAEHGNDGASWYEIQSKDHARRIVEDIDPEIVSGYPLSGMSGEIAGDYSLHSLVFDLDLNFDVLAGEEETEIYLAYQNAFERAVWDAIDKAAHDYLNNA